MFPFFFDSKNNYSKRCYSCLGEQEKNRFKLIIVQRSTANKNVEFILRVSKNNLKKHLDEVLKIYNQ
jgi:hypothetical protein